MLSTASWISPARDLRIAAAYAAQDSVVHQMFADVHAVSESGMYMRDNEDAAMNRAFIAVASRITVMADHTKLHAFASFWISSWSKVQRLITNAAFNTEILAVIGSQGVDIVIAP
mgnify:CR=1 FL=1